MSSSPIKKNPSAKGGAAKASPKLAAVPDAPAPAAAEEKGGQLRLKDLVDRVVTTSGGKTKEVREVVLATLAEISASLGRGESLNLPELGKVRVARRGDGPDGSLAMVLKVRKGGAGSKGSGQEALAEASE